MGVLDRNYARTTTYSEAQGTFAQKVYGWMTLGLLTTAVVAFGVIHTGLYVKLLPIWWLPTLGTMFLAMAINRRFQRATYRGLAGMFLGYSALQGLFYGTVLPLYAMSAGSDVIWTAFVTAGAIFGGAALYGALTKSDLTSMGRILRIGLIGMIGLTFLYFIMSFFVQLTAFHLLISYIGLVLFVGLTAYDSQTIRQMSHQLDAQGTMAGKLSLMMALKMYLNVIMIFWFLLQIFSSSRR